MSGNCQSGVTSSDLDESAQLTAENLAGGGFWDGVKKADFTGLLVMGEAIGDETAELFTEFAAGDKAIAKRNECHRDFSGVCMRATDDAELLHGWMFEQHGFDFRRCDRKSVVLNHFLAAVHDTIKPFAIAG